MDEVTLPLNATRGKTNGNGKRQCSREQSYISNNSSFRLKHPGVLDGSDGLGGTMYPLMEYYTPPVGQVPGHVVYSPPLLSARYAHHQKNMCVSLFAGAAVIL
jgi:hypothetical protein